MIESGAFRGKCLAMAKESCKSTNVFSPCHGLIARRMAAERLWRAIDDETEADVLKTLDWELGCESVNAKDEYGITALHRAARKGNIAIATLLLDRGAEVNAQDNYARTALHSAAWDSHDAAVAL